MSQYTSFFIRHNDAFLPMVTYSRSHKVAEAFNHIAPWEKIAPLTAADIRGVRASLTSDVEAYAKAIARARDEIEFLRTTNMAPDDLLEQYRSNIEYINDLTEEKTACESAIIFTHFLGDIIDEAASEHKWGENPLGIDENTYIYVGIEVGNPTLEDIER